MSSNVPNDGIVLPEENADFKNIIKMGFDECLGGLKEALEGLTSEERRFQPNAESHHIDFVVWHMARVEDDWVQGFGLCMDTIWRRQGWFEKLGLPEKDNGYRYTSAQVASLPTFDLDEIMAYFDSVRRETIRYIDLLSRDDLWRCPHPARRPGYTIGKMFSRVMIEEAQHVGQVSYLRGIQRGINK